MKRQRLLINVAVMLLLSLPDAAGQSKSFSGTSDELIGLWSGEGEMIEFRSDGKCRYGENLYPYALTQSHLVIEISGGSVTFAYEIKSGRLVLTADGQQSFYTRVTDARQVKPTYKDLRNPADLVGKWCYVISSTGLYTGRCMTLRSDGTYLFSEGGASSVQLEDVDGGTTAQAPDSGSWYVEGERLYYYSSTAGSGSYQLERRNNRKNPKYPMIVLNEEPFVATTQRSPWRN